MEKLNRFLLTRTRIVNDNVDTKRSQSSDSLNEVTGAMSDMIAYDMFSTDMKADIHKDYKVKFTYIIVDFEIIPNRVIREVTIDYKAN